MVLGSNFFCRAPESQHICKLQINCTNTQHVIESYKRSHPPSRAWKIYHNWNCCSLNNELVFREKRQGSCFFKASPPRDARPPAPGASLDAAPEAPRPPPGRRPSAPGRAGGRGGRGAAKRSALVQSPFTAAPRAPSLAGAEIGEEVGRLRSVRTAAPSCPLPSPPRGAPARPLPGPRPGRGAGGAAGPAGRGRGERKARARQRRA